MKLAQVISCVTALRLANGQSIDVTGSYPIRLTINLTNLTIDLPTWIRRTNPASHAEVSVKAGESA
jgi:hypothetical protein